MECLKYIIRYFKKAPTFDFSKVFYAILLPVLNALSAVMLAFLNVTGFVYPTDWVSWAKMVTVTVLGSLISVVVYNQGVKPWNAYTANNKTKKQAKAK